MSAYKVGDRIKFTNFMGSGNGIAIVKALKDRIMESYPEQYQILTTLESTNSKVSWITPGRDWYFPFSHITHEYTEVKYDPNQMVSEEDDI